MREKRYEVRFRLASGEPRSFRVWAFNKLEADVAGMRRLAELDGEEALRTALCYGAQKADY